MWACIFINLHEFMNLVRRCRSSWWVFWQWVKVQRKWRNVGSAPSPASAQPSLFLRRSYNYTHGHAPLPVCNAKHTLILKSPAYANICTYKNNRTSRVVTTHCIVNLHYISYFLLFSSSSSLFIFSFFSWASCRRRRRSPISSWASVLMSLAMMTAVCRSAWNWRHSADSSCEWQVSVGKWKNESINKWYNDKWNGNK